MRIRIRKRMPLPAYLITIFCGVAGGIYIYRPILEQVRQKQVEEEEKKKADTVVKGAVPIIQKEVGHEKRENKPANYTNQVIDLAEYRRPPNSFEEKIKELKIIEETHKTITGVLESADQKKS